jgi:hypothetical protein
MQGKTHYLAFETSLLPFVNDSGVDEDNPCVTVEVAAPADATP